MERPLRNKNGFVKLPGNRYLKASILTFVYMLSDNWNLSDWVQKWLFGVSNGYLLMLSLLYAMSFLIILRLLSPKVQNGMCLNVGITFWSQILSLLWVFYNFKRSGESGMCSKTEYCIILLSMDLELSHFLTETYRIQFQNILVIYFNWLCDQT